MDARRYHERLRAKGLRITPQRLVLLTLLERAHAPVGVAEITRLAAARGMDTVTIYRGLETLAAAGIVRRVDLRHGHADYELIRDDEHHHHAVCVVCGTVEDIEGCPDVSIRRHLMKRTKKFAVFDDHTLEFFGTCRACA